MEYCDQHMRTAEALVAVATELKGIRVFCENEAESSKEHRLESVPIRECVNHHTYQIGDMEKYIEAVDKKIDAQVATLRWGFAYGGVIGGVIGGCLSVAAPEVFRWIVGLFK